MKTLKVHIIYGGEIPEPSAVDFTDVETNPPFNRKTLLQFNIKEEFFARVKDILPVLNEAARIPNVPARIHFAFWRR